MDGLTRAENRVPRIFDEAQRVGRMPLGAIRRFDGHFPVASMGELAERRFAASALRVMVGR